MKLVIGLGNPGKKYAGTRHNAGFQAIHKIADHFNFKKPDYRLNALIAKGSIASSNIILAQPCSYMNKSGRVVKKIVEYYNIEVDNLIIIYDDLDLPTGKIRIKTRGSSGGHKGLNSIIFHLGTREFARIRIGIGRPPDDTFKITDYVLTGFTTEEKDKMLEAYEKTTSAIEVICKEDYQEAMNQFN